MPLYPTSFFVWRPAVGAYLYYTAIYNEDGYVVKFINEPIPVGSVSLHNYKESFTHTVGIVRPATHAEATRVRFYDFVERSCIRLVELIPASAAEGYWIHREREIPIMEPACAAVLPREMATYTLQI